jgi:5-methylcytosine-specific restriction endonuclease McrA
MNSSTNTAVSSLSASPSELSDAELLVATRLLVGRSNQLLAALLAHLAEVEARGAHRNRACSSLYTYCIYELRFSEDEAYRRVAAARLARRFPALLDAVSTGELHLTGLLMLGPHLTEENVVEVLARARHRTKKEIARLVRRLDPLPDVPSRIEPLGPKPARLVPPAPTWGKFVQSMCPVRELEPGARPRDWTEDERQGANDVDDREEQEHPAPAPARMDPQRYSVQFTASEEYVKLVEEAQALLSRSASRRTLDEIHLRAMRAFVAELKRQKYAVTERPRSTEPQQEHPRRRGRYVPAAVRRVVFERDEGRCTYEDDRGRRSGETHGIELHHLHAFALGGEHSESNLTLRCAAHNALAAEEDLGNELIEQCRSSGHESWSKAESKPSEWRGEQDHEGD